MKTFLLLILSACASYPIDEEDVINCCNDEIEYYGDLGAESSTGYEDMDGIDAHFEGVKRAAVGIKDCLGIKDDLWLAE